MIGVDTNILIHSHRRDSVWHERAKAAVKRLAEDASPWMIPWPCVHEFLAIVTHPKVFRPPSTIDEALGQVNEWMGSPSLTLGGETGGHWTTLRSRIRAAHVIGPAIHDARIAAICADHGVTELWSADRDFSRFPMLRVVNPLAGT